MNRKTRAAWLQFIYYNFGGAAFFVVSYLVFSLLYGLLHLDWVVAKVVSDGLGWLSNYGVQRYVAFRKSVRRQSHFSLMRRLIPLSLFNIPLDYAIVGGLKWLGVTPFIGLIVSSGFFTIWKWVWYKYWVFTKR